MSALIERKRGDRRSIPVEAVTAASLSAARKHSVDVADLRRWNHLTSDSVKPGQTLVVSQH